MIDMRKQVKGRVSTGWTMIVSGVVWFGFGILEGVQPHSTMVPSWFNLFMGSVGLAYGIFQVVRYRPMIRDERRLEREVVREHDEREILMRLKASRAAYGAMVTVCAIGITWTAMGSQFGQDVVVAMPWLWGAALLVPLGIYHLSYQIEARGLAE